MTTRAPADPPLPSRDGGEAVELMIELMSICTFVPSHASLAAYGTARDNWSVWAQARALRGVVALAGLPADEYALHSLCIGGATFLSAGGGVGRCSGERRKMEVGCIYERSHGVDANAVSDMSADTDAQPALQPGQKTAWDINGCYN